MKRVWVYEYLSGGGLVGDDPVAGNELRRHGVSMRDAMVADLLHAGGCIVTAAVCADVRAGATALPHGARPVYAEHGEPPLAFVARQAAAHDLVWLVAPETAGLLAQCQRVVAPARWLGCSGQAIELAGSKRATAERLAAHGVLTPRAFAEEASTQRWVTKPDDGAGAVATCVHADPSAARDDLATRGRAGEAVVLEAWVEGPALSLSLLCQAQQVELLSINRQHIAIDARGHVSFEGVSVDGPATADTRCAALQRLAEQVAHAIPGLRGFVGIDLVWHPERGPVVIEVNPRVTCAYVGLSTALGRNLARELIAAHTAEAAHGRP